MEGETASIALLEQLLAYWLDNTRLNSSQDQEISFFFHKMSRLALSLAQLQLGSLLQDIKWPLHEVEHSVPAPAQVENKWCFTTTPLKRPHDMYRDNTTFNFTFVYRNPHCQRTGQVHAVVGHRRQASLPCDMSCTSSRSP
jgi:hypothetical protein